MRSFSKLAFLCLMLTAASTGPSAAKNFFEELWEIGTDPLKLRTSSRTLYETAERSFIELNLLEEKANYDATQRIAQIDQVLKTLIISIDNTIATAINDLGYIEAKINSDANRLIYKAQCIPKTAVQDLREGYKQLISDIIATDPRIEIPVDQFAGISILTDEKSITAAKFKVTEIDIPNPDDAYFSMRDATLSALRKRLEQSEQVDAYTILSAYSNIGRAAKNTACFYLDQVLELRFVQELAEFERLSRPWTTIVNPAK